MNETEKRAELIDPVLRTASWGVVEGSRITGKMEHKQRLTEKPKNFIFSRQRFF